MPAPSTPVLDDFNTGANQRVTARSGWSSIPLFNFNTGLLTDAVPTYANAPETLNDAAWGTVLPADQEIWANFSAYGSAPAGTNDFYLRVSALNTASGSAAFYGYTLQRLASTELWRIFSAVAGVSTAITSGFTQAIAPGDSIGFNCIGNSISSWYKPSAGSWSPMETAVDGSVTSGGYIATDCYFATIHYDQIGGGAIGSAPPRRSMVRRA